MYRSQLLHLDLQNFNAKIAAALLITEALIL